MANDAGYSQPVGRMPQQARRGGSGKQQSGHGSRGGGSGAPKGGAQRNKVINRNISLAAESGRLDILLEAVAAALPEMNGINLATAFHRLAKLAPHSERELGGFKRNPVFTELYNTVSEHLQGHSLRRGGPAATAAPGEMPVQCLSIVAWSCASLQLRNRALFATIADLTAPRLTDLKPYELSNLLWAFAKVGMNHGELFKCAAERLLSRQEGEFKVQCLSTIAWSFATVKRRNLALFNSIAVELCGHVPSMKPQEMSNTLWAFAKNGYAHAELFGTLGEAIAGGVTASAFKPQELSNTAWAFATVGLQHPALFARIESVSMLQQSSMAPQNIANLLWAFAKLQVSPSEQFMMMVTKSMLSRLPQYKPAELSAVVWAMAQLSPRNADFFGVVVRACVDRAQEFSCNGVANLANALATVQMREPQLYVALLQSSVPRLQQLLPRALVTLLQGAARAATNPAYALHQGSLQAAAAEISAHAAGRLGEFQSSDLRELAKLAQGHSAEGSAEYWPALSRELPLAAKRPQSVGSMSTSADESHDDEDGEDGLWPTMDIVTLSSSGSDELNAPPSPSSAAAPAQPRMPAKRWTSEMAHESQTMTRRRGREPTTVAELPMSVPLPSMHGRVGEMPYSGWMTSLGSPMKVELSAAVSFGMAQPAYVEVQAAF